MLSFSFNPFPERTTERLILRSLRQEDVHEIFFLRSDPTVLKYIKKEPAAHLDEARDFISRIVTNQQNNISILWGMVPKGGSRLIGTICLWNLDKENRVGEVGYAMHTSYFGKGLMTEALLSVVDYGFHEMQLERIDAFTNKDNAASINMLKRNGFNRNFAFEAEYEDKEELEYNTIYSLFKSK